MIAKNIKWVLSPADEERALYLQKQLKIHPVLCRFLVQRGVTTFDQAKRFFRPSLKSLHNPFLMKDMDLAIRRINDAIFYGENILVYGDYDVDGTTAIATVYAFFKKFYNNIEYYVPNRYKEGYGISYDAIKWCTENNYTLIICLDCGIKAIDKIAYAKEQGIDFIICDHHLPGPELPPAVAVLDPKRSDCNYPYIDLSGCGIGFKLVQAYTIFHRRDPQDIYDLLDLSVVSIASDIVPITGENRILAYHGLLKLNENPRPGLKSMIELSGMKGKLSISDIVFVLGPRINAAGRMEDASDAVKLLTATELNGNADDGAAILQKHNTARKEVDMTITQEAIDLIDNDEIQKAKKSTVLYKKDWHKGVIGIVASRLMQRFYRPTVILTSSNGMVTGSARSVKNFNIYEAISSCSDLIEQFGGHKYAAGLTIDPKNVAQFINRFEGIVDNTITDDQLIPEIVIDADICLRDVVDAFYDILKQFAPFGPVNMKPVFRAKQVVDTGHSSIVGTSHLRLSIKQPNSFSVKAIAYGMANMYEMVQSGKPFDICFTIEENYYRNQSSIQLNIKDLKPSEINAPASQPIG